MERLGFGALAPGAGMAALGSLLGTLRAARYTPASLIASVILWDRLKVTAPYYGEFKGAEHKKAAVLVAAAATQSALTSPTMSADDIMRLLRSAVSAVLGASVADDQPLVEAGLDSLGAVELRNEIGRTFRSELPGTLVFDYPTVSAIAGLLASKLQPAAATATTSPRMLRAPATISLALPESRSSPLIFVQDMSARLPDLAQQGASNDAIRAVPLDRWEADAIPESNAGGRFGGFVKSWAKFDAAAFGITPSEAALMDPQQRVMLEDTWGMLAGGDADGRLTAVAVGVAKLGEPAVLAAHKDASSFVGTGRALSVAAGRISYVHGLKGPSVSIDTACSSSLVTTHFVCCAMRHSGCGRGLSVGANLPMNWETSAMFVGAGMTAADGRCKTLDATADGYVRSEACVAILFSVWEGLPGTSPFGKPGPPWLALVLAGTAVNQDGRSSSLTAPNGPSQQQVIRAALADAESPAADWTALEMHGTGTALGDPIEIGAASAVAASNGGGCLRLAAAKSRLGHAETAAGAIGICSSIVAFSGGSLPPISHLREFNPYVRNIIEAAAKEKLTPCIPRQVAPDVVRSGGYAVTGVSGFAFQGTNAHVLLRSLATTPTAETKGTPQPAWRHRRFWYAPQPHLFARCFSEAADRRSVSMEFDMAAPALAFLWDHQVNGRVLFPGAAMFEAGRAAGAALADGLGDLALTSIVIPAPLLLPKSLINGASLPVRSTLDIGAEEVLLQSLSSGLSEAWTVHLKGMLRRTAARLSPLQERRAKALLPTHITFSALSDVGKDPARGNAIGRVNLDEEHARTGYISHPAVVDCCMHLGLFVGSPDGQTRVPGALGAYSGTTAKSGASFACVDAGVQTPDGSLVNTYRTSDAALTHLHARIVSATPSAAPAAGVRKGAPDLARSSYATIWQVRSPLSQIRRPGGANRTTSSMEAVWQLSSGQQRLRGPRGIKRNNGTAQVHGALQSVLCFVQSGALVTGEDVHFRGVQAVEPFLPLIKASPVLAAVHGFLKSAAAELSQTISIEMISSLQGISHGGAHDINNTGDCHGCNQQAGAESMPILVPTDQMSNHNSSPLEGAVPGCSVVISGGLGALGSLVGSWAAASGAHNLTLLGRSASRSGNADLERLKTGAAAATFAMCDVSSAEECAAICGTCHGPASPLFFHAGGVVADNLIHKQTPSALRKVLAPKLDGAVNAFGALAAARPARGVAYFSSVAALLGNAGQANYSAANAALDALAAFQQSLGVLSCSIQWGAWAGSGMAAGAPNLALRLAHSGLQLITPAVGLAALGTVISGGSQLQAVTAVSGFDWGRLLKPDQACMPFFADVAPAVKTGSAPEASREGDQLPAAPAEDVYTKVLGVLTTLAREAMGAEVAPDQPLMSAGLDSLGAVELRNGVSAKFGVSLPATIAFDYPTLQAMARFVAGSMAPEQEHKGMARGGVASASQAPQPRTAAPPAEAVLADVQSVVESVLGAHIPADQPLMQAGLDSLGAVELRNALAAKFGVTMSATVAFDFPTAAALADYVRGCLVPSTELSTRQEYNLTLSTTSKTSFTAVCAIAARYPLPSGASPLDSAISGADQFWSTLSTGANLPITVPVSRWDIDDVYSPEPAAKNMYVRFGCFVNAVEDFDASAFRIASGEAVAMDPQARIALEQTQEAMHAAGGNADGEAAATGTYFGCMYTEYLDAILGPSGVADSNSAAITGHGLSFLVGRIAYTFGLQGPCVSTDTACSSSLVAVHQAHQGLMTGETAAAAAGGVNVMLTPQTTARICLLQALSPVGRCKTFDASGDGYGRGEGFTVAYLRGGENAASGAILALMRSSAVNQDGRSSSLTAPNGPSQQALVATCLLGANIGAEAVRYVAVHGTGTPLGDPIEVGALGSALGRNGSEPGHLTLGSNKACYGHTEGTAGITGALLAITTLRQAAAAPIVNLRSVNPYVTAALSDWRSLRGIAAHAPRQQAPGSLLKGDGSSSQVATGTSSFGMSGVNAHALFSAPDQAPGDSADESPGSPGPPALTWRAERHWVAPAAHQLLRSFSWGAAGGSCSFSVDLSAPNLAYLLDHQVMERPLLPGAGLLEMAAASGMALAGAKTDTVPVLAQALISSPCQLSIGGVARKLTCTLHPRQGSVQIASAHLHLTAVLTQLLPAGHHAAELAPLKSSSLHNILAGQINEIPGPVGKRQVAANVGVQGLPKQDAAGYGVHPALGDACIHLAAVPPAGQPILNVRVPVAVGARTGDAREGAKTGACGFCVAQPDGGNADGSTLNHMHWVAQGGSAQMRIRSLLAKVMVTSKSTPVAAANISYEVQWQALACTNSSSGKVSQIRRFKSQQGSLWELRGKENGAPIARRSCPRRPRESTLLEGLRRAGLHAQRHLADLQSLLSASKRGGRVALAIRGGRSGDICDQIFGAPLAGGLAAAPAWALLKVAAAEMHEKDWHMAGQSGDWHSAQQLHTDHDLVISGVDNIHGPAMSGGYWAAPKLLPALTAAAPVATLQGSMPRNILVSGGLGALGSLVAAWLAGQAMSAHAPNLTLLGRSGRVADPDTRRILAESQSQASVTMTKCDVALSADAEAMTSAQAGLGCPAIDCIIHAGGVLKDALLANQSAHSMRQAFAAKVAGAAQLAARSAGLLPVATGVAFSSIAGLLGSAGQGNYAAANAVLDEWSSVQSKQGMNAVSIQWGAWAGAGMAAHDRTILARLHRVGLGAIRPADGLAALHTALTVGRAGNAASSMAAAVFKWDRLLVGERALTHFYAECAAQTTPQEVSDRGEVEDAAQPAPSAVNGLPPEGQVRQGEGGNASGLSWAGMQPVERAAWVQAAISQAVSGVLGRPVGPEEPLMSAGLDSLGAVELRRELSRITTLDLPATLVFDYPSTGELATALAAMLPEPPVPEQARAPAAKTVRKAGGAESAATERSQQIKAWRPPKRFDIIAQVLAAVKTVMGADVSLEASLMSAGLDSLGAVELRKELASVTGLDLPTTLVFDYSSAESITDLIVSMLPSGPPPTGSTEVAASAEAQERAAVKTGGNRGTSVVESHLERKQPELQDIDGVIPIVPDTEEDMQHWQRPQQPRPPPVNPGAPRLTKDDYFTVPDMRRLKRMHDEELKAVERFVIGRKDVGEVAFIDPLDLRGVDLDAVVDMDKGRIQVYGLPGGVPRPAPGEGLNKPALLTFRRMLVKQKGDSSVAKFKAKLVDHAARLGGVFVHYDASTGNWIMKVDHF